MSAELAKITPPSGPEVDRLDAEQQWLARVMLPMVQGGEVRVDSARRARPIAPLPSDVFETELLVARQARLAVFSNRPLGLPFDDTTYRLCRAIGNLLASTHPAIGRRVRQNIVKEIDQDLDGLEPPADPDEQFRRLTLTWRLCALVRRDVTVRYWAGERTFLGEAVPRRLLSWQTVRRVHQEVNETLLSQALVGHEAARSFFRILDLAPLALVHEPLGVPAEQLFDMLPRVVVASRTMRFVLARFGALGLDKCLQRVASVAVARLTKQTLTKADVTTLRFFAHALVTWALGEPSDRAEPLRAAYELQFVGAASEGLWQIAALFAAAYRQGLAAPADLTGAAAEKVKMLYEATSAYAGEPRVRGLVAPLREVFG